MYGLGRTAGPRPAGGVSRAVLTRWRKSVHDALAITCSGCAAGQSILGAQVGLFQVPQALRGLGAVQAAIQGESLAVVGDLRLDLRQAVGSLVKTHATDRRRVGRGPR